MTKKQNEKKKMKSMTVLLKKKINTTVTIKKEF